MLAALGREELTDKLLARVESLASGITDLDRACVARIAQARGQRAMVRGELSAYLRFVEEASAVFKQAGDERNACIQQMNVGNVYLLVGMHARAEESVKGAIASADRMGLPSVTGFGLHILGLALARGGNGEAGREKELRALETFRAQGDRRMEAACLTYLAEIALLAEDLVTAERDASLAVALSEGLAAVRVQALAIHSSVLLARGQVSEALERTREGLALMEQVREIEEGEPLVRLVNAQALLRAGDVSGARVALAIARERILARADRIGDAALTEQFFTHVPAVVQTLALAREVLGEDIAEGA
jgi:tetratricopeptide (TPR) repeat protein